MPAALDLKGQKFGKLTVLEKAPNDKNFTCWKCKCDCGNIAIVRTNNLRTNHTTSCGCNYNKYKDFPINCQENKKLYDTWRNMKDRCYNPRNKAHKDYFDKGIIVCEEWLNNFEEFCKWAIQNGFKKDLSIDRINNDKNYTPENCRWVTMTEQAQNRSNNHWFEYNGEKHLLTEWAKIKGINLKTLENRIYKGMSIEEALNKK